MENVSHWFPTCGVGQFVVLGDSWEHLERFFIFATRRGVTGIYREETRDAAAHPAASEQHPQQRLIRPNVALTPRPRNLDVGEEPV